MDLFRPQQPSSSGSHGDTPSTSQGHEELVSPSNTVLFREIHKNAWLRKLPSIDKRSGAAPKKGERVWAVFCVHDDIHPFLELYMEQKMAAAHKPDWCVSLSTTLHVSPTIVALDQEYEFVITLTSDVVRLTAPSWEAMMEWVDTIRSKLREMRVLCPRENVYSRMPEPRLPLLPTRDPNSPLPPPPMGPSALVPGVEPVHLDSDIPITSVVNTSGGQSATQSSQISNRNLADPTSQTSNSVSSEVVLPNAAESRTRHRIRSSSLSDSRGGSTGSSLWNPGSNGSPARTPSNSSSARSPVPNGATSHSSGVHSPGPCASSPRSPGPNGLSSQSPGPSHSSRSPVSVVSVSSPRNRHPVSPVPLRSAPSFRSHLTNGNLDEALSSPGAAQNSSSRNIRSPVGQPSSSSHSRSPAASTPGNQNVTVIEVADSQRTPSDIFNFNVLFDSLPQSNGDVEPLEQFFTPPITPRSRASIAHPPQTDQLATTTSPPSRLWQQITQVVSNLIGQPTQSEVIRVTQGVTNITIPSQQESATESHGSNVNNVYEHVFPIAGNDSTTPADDLRTRAPQTAVSSNRPVPGEAQHRRRRTSSGSELVSPRSRSAANVLRHAGAPDLERRLHPVPHPFRQATVGGDQGTGVPQRVTLRDQQVQQLRKEKLHPGGVRLQVRRKDCTNSIAFIDAFGAVWIAGWKQREHPMLYNALHIGDQLLSVAGLSVQTSADAHRFIRASNSLYVPFIIRRVPFGHVFAFRRDAEGQSLGITLEGGTAEIKDIAADSPAARGGLPGRAPTCDGLSLTPWVITEINGRPLNLFFKDGEVRDRLNAVGKEISVLVQPFDLIKQIKKQLKTIRSYKQFIVQ
ncbi:serine/arginine repetitive matrix protein 2 [Frankliniella occidentalis]|uniref:Serine/arginine repetitive matrix protein 2 n=1 Tax=Frankliniella occidentalis TaxID=133901 RepID=A0A6J1S3P7_FRAOC|nr:serine/arginine repetitive matrix protein 2 [Frankliniella occidentalis]XP_026275657.1 serine/arginine repetitive matrix protein 2 [Frankliniella occidentalis]XP_052121828.1 serine/arginine repetitive matrix protein 2 [Frankliniella occidentalis]